MPTGSEALKLFEEGKVLSAPMGGGVKLRWNHVTRRMECLHEGQLPVSMEGSDQWVEIGLDVATLYKYEWTPEEEIE